MEPGKETTFLQFDSEDDVQNLKDEDKVDIEKREKHFLHISSNVKARKEEKAKICAEIKDRGLFESSELAG